MMQRLHKLIFGEQPPERDTDKEVREAHQTLCEARRALDQEAIAILAKALRNGPDPKDEQ